MRFCLSACAQIIGDSVKSAWECMRACVVLLLPVCNCSCAIVYVCLDDVMRKKNKGSMQGRIAFSDHSVFILKMWKLKDKLILCDFLFFMCCCFQKKNDKTFFKTSPVFIWKCESSKINRSLCNSFFIWLFMCCSFQGKKRWKTFYKKQATVITGITLCYALEKDKLPCTIHILCKAEVILFFKRNTIRW